LAGDGRRGAGLEFAEANGITPVSSHGSDGSGSTDRQHRSGGEDDRAGGGQGLAFTGFPAALIALIGTMILLLGIGLRRRTRG
jgi:hypothetical protein